MHEIDHGDRAMRGFEVRLENQRALAIAPRHAHRARLRCDQPAAVLGLAQQRGEASFRIETGPAQPIDGAIAPDEGAGVAVADQGVIFDPGGHLVFCLDRRLAARANQPAA